MVLQFIVPQNDLHNSFDRVYYLSIGKFGNAAVYLFSILNGGWKGWQGLQALKGFTTEENLSGVDPIIIFYFLIVIFYLSQFNSELFLLGRQSD